MKKKFFVAALAATMFASAALGLAACSKDPATGGDLGDTGLGGGGGGGGGGNAAAGYTITLDANGGSFLGSGSTKTTTTTSTGEIKFSPSAPNTAPTGKKFNGWGLTTSSDPLTFPHTFNAPGTIYALWTDNSGGGGGGGGGGAVGTEYTITFDPQDGTFVGESGSTVTRETVDKQLKQNQLPELAKREGYEMEGWFTEVKGGGSRVNGYTFSSNATVYASWKQTSQEVGGGGGGGTDPNEATYGAVPTTVTKDSAWLVGVISAQNTTWESDGWNKGYSMWRADEPNGGNKQFKIVVQLNKNDEVKIRYKNGTGDEGIGYDQIENKGDLTCIEEAAKDQNITIKETGYYTFYFKFEWDRNNHDIVYVQYSATKPAT